jgi:glycosyltransferase involved in cell wall biosynthesis
MKNLTLIIPAKYEKESLPDVLGELKNYKCKKIIVLKHNDTETIASIIKIKNLKIIYQKKNGYGNAISEGVNNCKTKFFCIFNADGSFNPSELKTMYNMLKNSDMVFGSRYQANSGSDDDNFITFIGNIFFTKLGNIFFKLPLTDILYTFVMGKTKKIKLLNCSSEDFSYCVELPIKAVKKKLIIKSTSSFERKRIGGKKKVNIVKDGFIILLKMIFLYFKK